MLLLYFLTVCEMRWGSAEEGKWNQMETCFYVPNASSLETVDLGE